jgi:hypothetical protein
VQELEEDLEMTETKFNLAMQKYEKVRTKKLMFNTFLPIARR